MTIGERIKFIRGKNSQKKFGQSIGADQSTVQVWETRNSIPKGDFLHRIHKTLGVDINWLLTGEGQPYLNQDESRIGDAEGLWGATKHIAVHGKLFAVTTYEPKDGLSGKVEIVEEFISDHELALVRTLRRTGDEYKKRVYHAVAVRAQNVTDVEKLETEDKERFKEDLEILTTKAIE
jgi:transcriptional regulator with XRE-family HTH domain